MPAAVKHPDIPESPRDLQTRDDRRRRDLARGSRRWNWRQGRRTRLTETSRNAYFIVEALSPPFEARLERAVEEIAGGLGHLAGASRVMVDRLR